MSIVFRYLPSALLSLAPLGTPVWRAPIAPATPTATLVAGRPWWASVAVAVWRTALPLALAPSPLAPLSPPAAVAPFLARARIVVTSVAAMAPGPRGLLLLARRLLMLKPQLIGCS